MLSASRKRKRQAPAIKGEATSRLGAGTHTGELDYDAKPSADKLKFGDETDENDCQVTLQLVGKHLVVGDNLHRGGANVVRGLPKETEAIRPCQHTRPAAVCEKDH